MSTGGNGEVRRVHTDREISLFATEGVHMSAKGDKEPLNKIVGSTGKANQAVKDYFRKLFQRGKPRA